MDIAQAIIIFLVTIFAGTFGVMFGGGNFIVIPVLLLMGFDAKTAIATSGVSGMGQLVTGSILLRKHHRVHNDIIRVATPFFLGGAIVGSMLFLQLPSDLLRSIFGFVLLTFAVVGFVHKEKAVEENPNPVKSSTKILGLILIAFTGMMMALTPAGVGTLMTFALMHMFGINFKEAISTRQLIDLIGFSVVCVVFIANGLVNWYLFIPLILGRIVGALIGINIVVQTETMMLRRIFNVIVLVLALYILVAG